MKLKSFMRLSLLSLLILCLTTTSALAEGGGDNVLVTIKERAVALMISVKPLVFVLAGFGLVAFAWGAIFDKLSWKWFSYIAIGLFLVANMGLFVDTFTGNLGSGGGSHLKADLHEQNNMEFGSYMPSSGGYDGTQNGIEQQQSETGDGATGNSNSKELGQENVQTPGVTTEGGNSTPDTSKKKAEEKKAEFSQGFQSMLEANDNYAIESLLENPH